MRLIGHLWHCTKYAIFIFNVLRFSNKLSQPISGQRFFFYTTWKRHKTSRFLMFSIPFESVIKPRVFSYFHEFLEGEHWFEIKEVVIFSSFRWGFIFLGGRCKFLEPSLNVAYVLFVYDFYVHSQRSFVHLPWTGW